jgi:hypothetical protein
MVTLVPIQEEDYYQILIWIQCGFQNELMQGTVTQQKLWREELVKKACRTRNHHSWTLHCNCETYKRKNKSTFEVNFPEMREG